MKKPKRIQRDYTTGEAAQICRCSLQTIIRCVDEGVIEGYYAPGTAHRRISSKNLFKYMIKNKIPMDNFPKKDLPKSSLELRAKIKK